MYEPHFGLADEPFSLAPDPRFLYLSDHHRDALAHLAYGLSRGASFVLLTGEVGAGKTTVWRHHLQALPPNVDVAQVLNPRLSVDALLARIAADLGVAVPPAEAGTAAPDLLDALHGHLLLSQAAGRRTLIVIDEAQALSVDVLEQLRLLTNLDTSGRKLQVLLIGQPELRQVLQQPALEPMAQRIVTRYHLPALSAAETAGYVEHRLRVAGLQGPLPFDADALALVHRLAGGVPRRINVLCDRALLLACARGQVRVDRSRVAGAAADVFGEAAAVVGAACAVTADGPADAAADPAAGAGTSGAATARPAEATPRGRKAAAFVALALLAWAAGVWGWPRWVAWQAAGVRVAAAPARAPHHLQPPPSWRTASAASGTTASSPAPA